MARGDCAATVVLALGNPLMGDDGLGSAVVTALRDGWTFDPPIALLDAGTSSVGVLTMLQGVARLLLVDAIDIGSSPGTVVVLERADVPTASHVPISAHDVGLREALVLAQAAGVLPETTVVIGMQPANVGVCSTLSPTVGMRVSAVVQEVVARLRAWGHHAQPAPSVVARSCTN